MENLYPFHPDTRIYTGQPDTWPIDPVTGQPAELTDPPQSAPDAPPEAPAGTLVRRLLDNSGWELVPDIRGTWYDADGQAVQIDDLDADVSQLTREAPPDATYKLVNGKWEQCPDKAAAAKKAEMDMAVAAGMAAANQHIAVLQDAVDLEMATPEEEAALKSWRRYRVLLSRLRADAKYPDVKLPQRPDGGTA